MKVICETNPVILILKSHKGRVIENGYLIALDDPRLGQVYSGRTKEVDTTSFARTDRRVIILQPK